MKINKRFLFTFLFSGILFLTGCNNNTNGETEVPRSFLKIEAVEENEEHSALYSIVDPITEQVSVVHSMNDDFEYYNLENYEITKETISFVYDGMGIELTLESNSVYKDSFGNTYQMKVAPAEES